MVKRKRSDFYDYCKINTLYLFFPFSGSSTDEWCVVKCLEGFCNRREGRILTGWMNHEWKVVDFDCAFVVGDAESIRRMQWIYCRCIITDRGQEWIVRVCQNYGNSVIDHGLLRQIGWAYALIDIMCQICGIFGIGENNGANFECCLILSLNKNGKYIGMAVTCLLKCTVTESK